MTSIKHNVRKNTVEIKDGRKVLHSIPTTATPKAIAGVIEGADTDLPVDELLATLTAALEAAAAKRGSVVPDEYRYRYGADQNCGDKMAKQLTKLTTNKDGVDLAACERIAAANGISDRFDGWMAKGLNNGMVRMNLGNVLRGKLRRDEEVTLTAK